MHVVVPSRTWLMGAAVCFSLFCRRSGRRAVRRPGLRCAGVVMTVRRLSSIRFAPAKVNRHHPCCVFTRVITAGLFAPATMWDRPGSGGVSLGRLEQAEFAGAGDRRAPVLHAQFAVQGALVGFHGVE